MFLLKRPEPKLTLAQKALLRARQIDARGLFGVINVLLLLLVGLAAHRFPHKFVRVTGEYVRSSVASFSFSHGVLTDAVLADARPTGCS
jgi:hypothetical protein